MTCRMHCRRCRRWLVCPVQVFAWPAGIEPLVNLIAGGAGLIADDIAVLLKYVEDHLDPDDNPLDGLVEATLLRKWNNLEKDGMSRARCTNFVFCLGKRLPDADLNCPVNDFLDAYKE